MNETQVILNRLLDKFENSKHLIEPNTSKRRVMLRVKSKDFPEYEYENASVRDAYNTAALELERRSFVRLEWARKEILLSEITLNLEQIMPCYEQAGRVHPRKKVEHVAELVSHDLENSPVAWIAAWRDEVCEAARDRFKVPSFCKENDQLLRDLLLAFQRYAELTDSVTMRAFSSQCFHDTKYFERNVREIFLRIAKKYDSKIAAACQERELSERDQLAFLGIYARPERYELSGNCILQTQRGKIDIGAAEPYGLALPSTLVDAITEVDLKKIRCVTLIENKTNYDEYLLSEKQNDELVIYHGGFPSPKKRKLFMMLAAAIVGPMEVRFWADIDRGGFLMFEHLQEIFPQVKPMRMDGSFVAYYHQNGYKRSKEYISKLEMDMKNGLHPLFVDAIHEIMTYGVTIEQEVFLN